MRLVGVGEEDEVGRSGVVGRVGIQPGWPFPGQVAWRDGALARLGGGPETVARKIEKAISKRRPKTRYPVTASARMALAQRSLMTDRMWDGLLRSQYPQPGKSG